MSADILKINSGVRYDNAISRFEIHTHQPYVATTFNNSDEIRIPIQQQDIYTLPSESFLYIEGRVVKADDGTKPPNDATIVNNGIAFLFDEIRYEINGVEIEKCKLVGICSTMKAYVSLHESESRALENAGWSLESNIADANGYFNVCIPLRLLLGFAEDYKKIIVNVKQELILIRARHDMNAYKSTTELKFNIAKLQWRVPHISVADVERLNLLKIVESNKTLSVAFRSRDLYEYPLLPTTMKQTWSVKTATQLEKPRYVIVGFQCARKNIRDKDMSQFDACNLTNIKLYLNSTCYPYDNFNLNFNENQYALLYDNYSKFQKSYYDRNTGPLLSKQQFKEYAPLVVINCSNQNESLKSASVDIRLEFESNVVFPANTSAYCLIIHDRIVEYNPMSGYVRTLV